MFFRAKHARHFRFLGGDILYGYRRIVVDLECENIFSKFLGQESKKIIESPPPLLFKSDLISLECWKNTKIYWGI